MATPLKESYNREHFVRFGALVAGLFPGFDSRSWIRDVMADPFDSLELKQRMARAADVLNRFLPQPFPKTSRALVRLVRHLQKTGIREAGIEYMFLPEVISRHGLEHPEDAIQAMEVVTSFTSCEFAVRPFLLRYPERMLDVMMRWTGHQDPGVRRLASEGSRPRLPWGLSVPLLKQEPSRTLGILEKLKADPAETVRRSVANHLNDISRDHPDLVLEIVRRWKSEGLAADTILRHASRGLLKRAHPGTLSHYGLDGSNLVVDRLGLLTPEVIIGQHLEFSFRVRNTGENPARVRLEYAIGYRMKQGKISRKVFKISERDYEAGESAVIHRRHSFRPITTRTYYPGVHEVTVIVNGREGPRKKFELKPDSRRKG